MKQLRELYEYREMIFSLVKKDLRGRYKGSVLGFLWTFINPLLQLVVFTLVFSVIMKAGYEQYYMFLFVALVPWMFFASSVQDGSTSILREKDMVKKIYFPREVLPIATVTSGFVNMLLTFIVIFAALRKDDMLIITADHGCDPTTPSTDHSREYVPLLMYGEALNKNVDLGTGKTYANIAQTIADIFGTEPTTIGESYAKKILKNESDNRKNG